MLRWKKTGTHLLEARDKWTGTTYVLSEMLDGTWHLRITVDNCEDTLSRYFKTLGSAKGWVTKNFG